MTPKQTAWIKLIALALGTGCAAAGTSYAAGAKIWGVILVGVGTAASAVYHSLSPSPNDTTNK